MERNSKLHKKQVQRVSEWAQDFIIHLLTTLTTNLQTPHKTVFSNSTWAKRVVPHTQSEGYPTSIHVFRIMSEVTIVEYAVSVHVMTAFEAVEL
jgi:hypothetical protein